MKLHGLAIAAVLGACAGSQGAPGAAAPPAEPLAETMAPEAVATPSPRTGLELRVSPADAEVLVDGQANGKITDHPGGFVPLAPGLHQIVLQCPGYAPWRAELTVAGAVEVLAVDLKAARPRPSP